MLTLFSRKSSIDNKLTIAKNRILKSLNDSYVGEVSEPMMSDKNTIPKEKDSSLPAGSINIVRAVYDEAEIANKKLEKRRDELIKELKSIEIEIEAHSALYEIAKKYIVRVSSTTV